MLRPLFFCLSFVLLPILAAPPRFDPGGEAPPVPGTLEARERMALPDPGPDHLRWLSNMDTAQMSARAQGQMRMVFFSSSGCSWCQRLKREVLADPGLRNSLRQFTLVEIDVDRNPALVMRLGIRNVPTLVWMDTNGREVFRNTGFLSVEDLGALLGQLLSPGTVPASALHAGLLKRLAEEPPTEALLVEAISLPPARDPGGRVREALRTLSPPPAGLYIDLLRHPRLIVRLGALEFLEEIAGTSRGFDPWNEPGSEANREALSAWRAWIDGAPDIAGLRSRYARLTREQMEEAVRDLASEDSERGTRAMRTLELAGPAIQSHLKTVLAREDLPEIQRSRLENVHLTLDLQGLGWPDPAAAAHRLRRAPLDTRLHLLRAVRDRGAEAAPVLTAFLNDPDILIREAAVEGLLLRGGVEALPRVLSHLETEESIDIAVTAMRNLKYVNADSDAGGIFPDDSPPPSDETTPISDWLKSQLESGNEERILAALNAIREGSYPVLIPKVVEGLSDERWRVRAEAARTLGGTRSRDRLPDLLNHVRDPDPFARNMILETALSLAGDGKQREDMLQTWWRTFPDDRLDLLRIACGTRVVLPEAFFETLSDRPSGELITVLGVLEGCASSRIRAGLELAGHSDPDVRAAALRLLARHGLSAKGRERNETEVHLVSALVRQTDPQRLALVDAIRLPRDSDESNPLASLLSNLSAITAEDEGSSDPLLDDLLGAFADPSADTAPAADAQTKAPAAGLDDLLAAFEEPVASKPASGGASLEETLLDLFQTTREEALRLVCARVLVEMGNPAGLQHLLEQAALLPEEDLIRVLARPGQDDVLLEAARTLLDDSRGDIRNAAALQLAARDFTGTFLPLFFQDPPAIQPDSVPWNRYQIQEKLRESPTRDLQPFIVQGLNITSPDEPIRYARLSLALAMASQHRDGSFLPLLETLTRDLVDPHLRAQAWIARFQQSAALTNTELEQIQTDPATPVRLALPWWLLRTDSKEISWHVLPDMAIPFRRRATPPRVASATETVLVSLLADTMPEVRLLAGAALISQNRTPQETGWLEALSQLQDRSGMAESIWDAVESQVSRLGPEYRPFVDWLVGEDLWRVQERTAPWYARHARQNGEPEAGTGSDSAQTAFLQPEFQTNSDERPPDVDLQTDAENPTVTLLYFYSEGCWDCVVVREMLKSYESMFPDLILREMDMTDPGAMDLYYEIYRAYGLPLGQVGLTPMVAGSGGADCGAEALSYERIGDIIARSLDTPGSDWIPEPPPGTREPVRDEVPPDTEPVPEDDIRTASSPSPRETTQTRERPEPTPLSGWLLLLCLPIAALFVPFPSGLTLLGVVAALLLGAVLPGNPPPNSLLALVIMLILWRGGDLMLQARDANPDSLSVPLHRKKRNPAVSAAMLGSLFFLVGLCVPLRVWPDAAAHLPGFLWIAASLLSGSIFYARKKRSA